VLISVFVHGATAAPLAAWYARWIARETLPEEREGMAAGLFGNTSQQVPRISTDELADQLAGSDPPVVLDVRSRSEYDRDNARIPGSIRVLPDRVEEWAAGRSRDRPVVAFCT